MGERGEEEFFSEIFALPTHIIISIPYYSLKYQTKYLPTSLTNFLHQDLMTGMVGEYIQSPAHT